MDCITCWTEHDTVRGTMTQRLAGGVCVVVDFRAGQIVVLRNGNVVNRFSLRGMTLSDYEVFLLNTAKAAQDIR